MATLEHDDYITGERDVTTVVGIFSAGQTTPLRTPIARVSASGELKPWDPAASDGTQKAIGLTVFDIDTSAGASENPYHDGGCFNPELINWPETVTAEQKAGCFDQTAIAIQKLGG